ncbi:EAL domain-containing protein [Hankyongella ginsenosidimutans]|uniref:EAL domain-containing protein n=1 Tax=Hankyongella ginsenosidimutans TaxID=1763828 RepID=UPI003CCC5CA5
MDRSFVLDMLANPASDVIVRSTVDLAHNLGMRVVAEGVETRDHYNRLRQLLRTSRRVISSRFR